MGCLVILLFAVIVFIWYQILKHLGYSPLVEEYCTYFGCDFPDDYVINWFGRVWWWSPLWLPLLIITFINLRKKLSDINNWWHFKKSLAVHKKKLVLGGFFSVIIVAVSVSIYYYNNKIENLNQYSNSKVESYFNKELPDFSYVEGDYNSRTLNVYFVSVFDFLTAKNQYVTLDKIRAKYLKVMQEKGHWENFGKEDIVVNAMSTTLADIASLKGIVLTNRMDETFNGSKLTGNETLPVDALIRWQNASNKVSGVGYNDFSCNDTKENSLARSQCVERVIQDNCGQYMGSYMRDGKNVNWGKVQDTERLKACIKENISPENVPFPYRDGD
ncbi:hypothetical protein CN481_00235 [Bacillus sp. AFS006103]|nr:hypothetical protein CN481_00235 [Bacillus sp. AFS006103]